MTERAARLTGILLGLWLLASAFLWPHTDAQQANACIVGLLLAGSSALALRFAELRWAATLLSVWLFLSVWALPTPDAATAWNHLLLAITAFVLTLVPAVPDQAARVTLRRSHAAIL
jgi:hypothetical protein